MTTNFTADTLFDRNEFGTLPNSFVRINRALIVHVQAHLNARYDIMDRATGETVLKDGSLEDCAEVAEMCDLGIVADYDSSAQFYPNGSEDTDLFHIVPSSN